MERVKEIVRSMFYRYCIVYTLIMGVNLGITCVTGQIGEAFRVKALLFIEAMAALCALGDLMFWIKTECSKRVEFLRYVLHYLYINLVVFGVAVQTMNMDIGNIVVIAIAIAVIYWINILTDFYKNKKDALKMNDLLEKINNNDD